MVRIRQTVFLRELAPTLVHRDDAPPGIEQCDLTWKCVEDRPQQRPATGRFNFLFHVGTFRTSVMALSGPEQMRRSPGVLE